jgi:hypothetical protein
MGSNPLRQNMIQKEAGFDPGITFSRNCGIGQVLL